MKLWRVDAEKGCKVCYVLAKDEERAKVLALAAFKKDSMHFGPTDLDCCCETENCEEEYCGMVEDLYDWNC